MSKSKPARPRIASPSRCCAAALLQHGQQRFEQVAVFAAQVDQALARADREGRDRHALEHVVGVARQQHPVLEGAGFAFVGVAHHVMGVAGRVAAQGPFAAGGETGATASAQLRGHDLVQRARRATRQRRGDRTAGRQRQSEQHVGAPDLVVDVEPLGRPLLDRNLLLDQFGDPGDTLAIEPRHDLVVVDQQRRTLVAQPGAGAAVDADQAVGAGLPGLDAQPRAQVGHQRLAAEHAVGDVVAEQDAVAAHRPGMEEAVEAGHAFDLGQAQLKLFGKPCQHATRQPAFARLHLAQDLHQGVRIRAVARRRRRQQSCLLGSLAFTIDNSNMLTQRRTPPPLDQPDPDCCVAQRTYTARDGA